MPKTSFIQQLENLCDEYSSKLNDLTDDEKRVLSTCFTLLGTYYSPDKTCLKYLNDVSIVIGQSIVNTTLSNSN